jgi:hypothetical protein
MIKGGPNQVVKRTGRYLDKMKGQPIGTLWDDILPVQAQADERLGYPTHDPGPALLPSGTNWESPTHLHSGHARSSVAARVTRSSARKFHRGQLSRRAVTLLPSVRLHSAFELLQASPVARPNCSYAARQSLDQGFVLLEQERQ